MTGTDAFCALPGGIRLCYRVDGTADGDPVLLVGGIGFDLSAWPGTLVSGLTGRGLRVVRFDNRDCGRSSTVDAPAPPTLRLMTGTLREAPYDLADMAGDAVGLLDHLGIGRAHVVGMSMGGMIAQTLAARHPDRVASLTSVFSTTGHPRVGRTALSTMLMLGRPPARTRQAAVAREVALRRHIASRGFPFDAEEARRSVTASQARLEAGVDPRARLSRQIAAIRVSGDRTAELRRVLAPTLVVHGDDDRMVHPSGGAATLHAITGARLRIVPGMGHDFAAPLVPRIVELVGEHVRTVAAREPAARDAP
ncbi:alpha/beta fold hydrolase [Streptomyces sp. NPDC090106]|uniref:alpha/beta fold hydrolase n=1 Tax=Streptomyces sp. NPDC090106 TaxID=3365946 RepID=UPI0037F67AF6